MEAKSKREQKLFRGKGPPGRRAPPQAGSPYPVKK